MTITLNASAIYGHGGQYIALITGRAERVQFARQFVGHKHGKRNEETTYETDELGLYEVCHITKRGKDKNYVLVLPWKDDLRKLTSDTEDALKIAKRLDAGERLEDFVFIELGEALTEYEHFGKCSTCSRELAQGETCPDHPEAFRASDVRPVPKLNEQGKPLHKLTYAIRSKVEVKKVEAAGNVEAAVEAIVAALQALPEKLQRQALKLAKDKVFPPAPKVDAVQAMPETIGGSQS